MWKTYRSIIRKYPKMSLQEERRLIRQAKKGSKKAADELVQRHIGFVIFRINKRAFPAYVRRFGEDILSQAIFVLYNKIQTYNLRYYDEQGNFKPVRLVSYIWKAIDGLILASLRKELRHEKQTVTGFRDGEEYDIFERISAANEPIIATLLGPGEEDKKLTVPEIGRLVEKKRNYVYLWGSEVSEVPIGKANVATLRTFIKRGKDAGRISFSFDSAKNVLNKLHLVKSVKLLNAGRALFCKDNGVEVQAAVFAGKDKITFLDIQSFHGNLFDLIEKSESYVKEHINWRADLSGSKRIEIPEIPIRAIKEAIINSLCHRDFTNPKSNEIAIYRDRIEIFNPGQFPYEYSPEDFVKGDLASIPRNPLIAETLYLSEDIEKWGSGLRRISEECKTAGVKMGFRKSGLGFVVIFFRPELGYSLESDGRKSKVKSKVKSKGKVIEMITQNPSVTIPEMASALNMSIPGIEKIIRSLKKAKQLLRIGPDKGGHWKITK